MGSDRPRILIVSAPAAAVKIRLSLAAGDFTDVETTGYESALASINHFLPDLILLVNQVGNDTLYLTSTIVAKFPTTPVVVLGNDIMSETLSGYLAAGASDYIYFQGNEKEFLAFVINKNLKHARQLFKTQDEHETATLYAQLEKDQRSGFLVQQAMLPRSPSTIGGLTFDHKLYPSMFMSGDFIDYFELVDGRVAFCIADVSGHGASSAFITVLLKSMSRRLSAELTDLSSTAKILTWFNKELLQWQIEHHVTMFFGIIDQRRNRLVYSNAAHFPASILCYQQGAEVLDIGGQPLGLFEQATYSSKEIALPERFCLFMFSDGVFDVLPDSSLEEKEAKLLELVSSNIEMELDAMVERLGILDRSPLPDDIAVFRVASAA